MDKSSPVFENFENKMAAMSGRPKINRSTFKIGSGDLVNKVANNEKKITTLKNIFKAQRIEIGEKITPKVNTVQEALISTNIILTDIATSLEKDYSDRIKEQKDLLKRENKLKLQEQRDRKEGELETVKKVGGFLKKTTSPIIKPFSSIFDKLLSFGKILLIGVGLNNAIKWLSNPKNMKAVENLFDKALNNLGLTATLVGGTLVGGFILANKLLKGILTLLNPMTYLKLLSKAARRILPKSLVGSRVGVGPMPKNVSTLSKFSKVGSKLRGPLLVVGAGFDYFGRKAEGQSNAQALVGTGGGVAGALAGGALGAKAGAAIGGTIGAFFAGVGAVPGAAIGGALGGIIGSILGGFTGGKVADAVTGVDSRSIGGSVTKDMLYLVGENGPEILKAPFTGSILRNSQNMLQLADTGDLEEFLTMPIQDLRTNKNNKPVATKTSESKVSQPPFINPINADNRYMIETPILLGFDDLVYT